jgi:hypothetical protein
MKDKQDANQQFAVRLRRCREFLWQQEEGRERRRKRVKRQGKAGMVVVA